VSKVAASAVWGMFERRNGAVRLASLVIFQTKTKSYFFKKNLKLKIYYTKWTLRIEVVNGIYIYIFYCIFRVYLVTGPIKGR
jgi:hypothetical protein